MSDVYIWISPRGFGNEGTVHIVPAEHEDTAVALLDDMRAAEPDLSYRVLDDGREAQRKAMKNHAGWAHTRGYGGEGDSREDTVEASRWLYQTPRR